MKIIVDCDKCQGHALCASQAPEVYELDDTGYNRMGEVHFTAYAVGDNIFCDFIYH